MAAGGRAFWALALAALALGLAAPAAPAKQTHLFLEDFCEPGTGPGEPEPCKPSFSKANELTVVPSSGDLLVIDSNAGTVSRFEADGTPHDFEALGTNVIDGELGPGGKECAEEPASCDATPAGGLSFTTQQGQQQMTVDDSGPLSPTDGNIYVTQGTLGTAKAIEIFAASGEYLSPLTGAGEGPGEIKFGAANSFSPCGVAVDGEGNLFVAGGGEERIYKYEPTANPPVNADHVGTFPMPKRVCNLASGTASSAGFLFAARHLGGGTGAVY